MWQNVVSLLTTGLVLSNPSPAKRRKGTCDARHIPDYGAANVHVLLGRTDGDQLALDVSFFPSGLFSISKFL